MQSSCLRVFVVYDGLKIAGIITKTIE